MSTRVIGKQENFGVSTFTIPSHCFNSELGVLVFLLPNHSMCLGLSFLMSKVRELYFMMQP